MRGLLSAYVLIANASSRLEPSVGRHIQVLIRMLECFLQISGQKISQETFSSPEFGPIYRTFIGAIWSGKIIDRSPAWKSTVTRALNALFSALLTDEVPQAATYRPVPACPIANNPEIQNCIDEFYRLPLIDEKIWLWRGWLAETRCGKLLGLPLFGLYVRMGREFTEQFFNVCDVYSRARRGYQLAGLNELTRFIAEYPKRCTPTDLQDPKFTTIFWREFLAFYMVSRFANGNGPRISSLVSEWRKRVVNFVTEALEPSGLIAKPYGELPSPAPNYVAGSRTNIRTTESGEEVKVKLITDIPLQVTDEEAMQLLFHQIQSDHDVFVEWAEWATKDIWNRYQRRIALAPEGVVRELHSVGMKYGGRRWQTDRRNPKHLQNAAATFSHYGFRPESTARELSSLYPFPITQTARELALPVTDALYPHCILLVAEHPVITPSYLENLELFDRNGYRCGFVSTDGGALLVGCKFRKGARLGEQKVALTPRTSAIVEQIIALTQPIRDFLKAENNDDWRYLLLTCKKAFGYPSRVQDLSLKTYIKIRVDEFADSLGNTCKLSHGERLALVTRFSLVALRSSAAVLVYLRTGSVEAMSKALGHATHEHRLLSSYLPEPIAAFFQDRWIQIFQTGVVVQSLEGSEFLLEATRFESMDELDEFLRNHALKVPPPNIQDDQQMEAGCDATMASNQVVFGVNAGILTALLSLQVAVEQSTRQVSAKARYWAGIGERLVAFIESELNNRPDLKGCLRRARLKTDPAAMVPILYG